MSSGQNRPLHPRLHVSVDTLVSAGRKVWRSMFHKIDRASTTM